MYVLIFVFLSTLVLVNGQVNCPYLGAYIRDPEDCKSYYICGNIIHKSQCGPLLVFNDEHDVCDWPANVPGCENTYNQDTTDVCPSTGISYMADEDDCEMYYKCENGIRYHLDCGLTLVWDDSLQQCNYRSQVPSCITNPVTTETPGNPLPMIPGYVDCSLGIYHADLTNCQWYYQCNGSQAYHNKCPSGLIWDVDEERCGNPVYIPKANLYCNIPTTAKDTTTPRAETTTAKATTTPLAETTTAKATTTPLAETTTVKATTTPLAETTTVPVTVCYLASTPAPVCPSEPGDVVTTVAPETICRLVENPVKRQVDEQVIAVQCGRNGRFRRQRPEDGSEYVTCFQGQPTRRRCRSGKTFNEIRGRCIRGSQAS